MRTGTNTSQGQQAASAVNASAFHEVSARTGENVDEAWRAIVASATADHESGRRNRAQGIHRHRAWEAVSDVGVAVAGVVRGLGAGRGGGGVSGAGVGGGSGSGVGSGPE